MPCQRIFKGILHSNTYNTFWTCRLPMPQWGIGTALPRIWRKMRLHTFYILMAAHALSAPSTSPATPVSNPPPPSLCFSATTTHLRNILCVTRCLRCILGLLYRMLSSKVRHIEFWCVNFFSRPTLSFFRTFPTLERNEQTHLQKLEAKQETPY